MLKSLYLQDKLTHHLVKRYLQTEDLFSSAFLAPSFPINNLYLWLSIPQMAKNKGLTPKRKKIDRNPRVKNREKFRRAKIRRKGQVCVSASFFF